MWTNKMPFISLLGMLLLPISILSGQEGDILSQSLSPEAEIKNLASSTILIRLNSQKARVDYRKKNGGGKQLSKLQESIKNEHSEIISGANAYLKFSKYYFFYSHDSDAVIKKNDYSYLFDADNNQLDTTDYPQSCYLLSLEKPSWFSQIDSYFLMLYKIDKGSVHKLKNPMPFAFRTKSGKLFKRYDFKKAFRKMDERLFSFLSVQSANQDKRR